jgi:hypothetical protein
MKFKIQSSKLSSFVLSRFRAFVPSAFCFLIPAFCLFASLFSSCDKEEKLFGTWRLQTVFMNGDTLRDSLQYNLLPKYTLYVFFLQNSFELNTVINGIHTTSTDGFYSFKNKSTINLNYTIRWQHYSIEAKIKKLTRRELTLEYSDNGNEYLLILYTY